MSSMTCAPWCIHGDGHPRETHRVDQVCYGLEHIVVLSLDEHAPAAHAALSWNDPHVTVYAAQRYYRLPEITIHVYREHDNPHRAADVDFKLTPGEAVALANNLLTVVEQIAGGA